MYCSIPFFAERSDVISQLLFSPKTSTSEYSYLNMVYPRAHRVIILPPQNKRDHF